MNWSQKWFERRTGKIWIQPGCMGWNRGKSHSSSQSAWKEETFKGGVQDKFEERTFTKKLFTPMLLSISPSLFPFHLNTSSLSLIFTCLFLLGSHSSGLWQNSCHENGCNWNSAWLHCRIKIEAEMVWETNPYLNNHFVCSLARNGRRVD